MANATTQNLEAKSTPKSADYYENIYKKTWSRRTAGFLAGGTLFAAFGALGGAVVSFLPAVLASAGVAGVVDAGLPSLAIIAGNAALLGGAAAWLGMSIGGDVGSNAGSVVAAMEERDRQANTRGLELNPEPAPKKPVKMFNWKTAAVMAGVFAAFGAMIAFSPLTASATLLMGFKVGSAAAVAASATIAGMLGGTMGINFPHLSHKLTKCYSGILNGKAFESEPEKESSSAVSQPKAVERTTAPALPAPEAPELQTTNFATRNARFSRTAIIEKTEELSATGNGLQR